MAATAASSENRNPILSVESCHAERPESSSSNECRTLSRSQVTEPHRAQASEPRHTVRKLSLHRASNLVTPERRTLSRRVIRSCSCRASDPVTFSVESCHVERRTLSRSAPHPVTRRHGIPRKQRSFQATTEKQGIRVQIPCFHAPGMRAPWKRARSPVRIRSWLARGLDHCTAGGAVPGEIQRTRITDTPARVLVDRRSLI